MVVSHMKQESEALLARHAGTSAAKRRARICGEIFATLRLGPTAAFAILLLPDRPGKRSHLTPYGPSEKFLANCFHNERVEFSHSQGNVQLSISEDVSSDMGFSNFLRKVSEAAKCLVNHHSKFMAKDLRTANKGRAVAAAEARV